MQSLQPEQATFLLQMALPALKNEYRLTRKVIEAIPAGKGDYRPDPASKSATDLAWHIVATEDRFMKAVLHGAFDFTPMDRPDDILAWYDQNFQSNFDQVAKATPEQLMRIVDFRGMFQLPAVVYLQFVINHSIHHRGQLSVYLRPMGGKVPSIYGESYDDAQARKAAQAQSGAA